MTKEARIYNGAKTVSSTVILGKLDSHMSNNEIRTFLHTKHKNNLKYKT